MPISHQLQLYFLIAKWNEKKKEEKQQPNMPSQNNEQNGYISFWKYNSVVGFVQAETKVMTCMLYAFLLSMEYITHRHIDYSTNYFIQYSPQFLSVLQNQASSSNSNKSTIIRFVFNKISRILFVANWINALNIFNYSKRSQEM